MLAKDGMFIKAFIVWKEMYQCEKQLRSIIFEKIEMCYFKQLIT